MGVGDLPLGTLPESYSPLSSPDTFASKTAAIEDETADNSVGNVTGSNAVNVFLGIGIAWTMAAIYWESQGLTFNVPVGRFVHFHFIHLTLRSSASDSP